MPRGFTLIEVLVALLVGGIALLVVRGLFDAATTSAHRGAAAQRAADAEANGFRVARALLDRADWTRAAEGDTAGLGAGATGSVFTHADAWSNGAPLVGDARAVRFATWCDATGGWTERCTATLRLKPESSADTPSATVGSTSTVQLAAELSTGERLRLRAGLRGASLRYLATAADGGVWVGSWARRELPLAVGVVGEHDTLLFAVGAGR